MQEKVIYTSISCLLYYYYKTTQVQLKCAQHSDTTALSLMPKRDEIVPRLLN